jgi:hypothetical protein
MGKLRRLEPTGLMPFEMGVHAELNLIKYHINNRDTQPYNYIGGSKLCCLLCHTTIESHARIESDRFYAQGTHGKVYPGWVIPNLFPTNPERQEELSDYILEQVKDEIVNWGRVTRSGRLLSDSSASDGSSEELTPEELDELGKY